MRVVTGLHSGSRAATECKITLLTIASWTGNDISLAPLARGRILLSTVKQEWHYSDSFAKSCVLSGYAEQRGIFLALLTMNFVFFII